MPFGKRDSGAVSTPPVKELPVPPAARSGKGASEVFRAFIVDGGLQVSLQRGFDDPRMWGILLADVARHASRVYQTEGVTGEVEAMAAIRQLFDAELDRPTDLGSTSRQH
ncbi:MAG: DUF5076 domain-containing protein [Devosia sp.]